MTYPASRVLVGPMRMSDCVTYEIIKSFRVTYFTFPSFWLPLSFYFGDSRSSNRTTISSTPSRIIFIFATFSHKHLAYNILKPGIQMKRSVQCLPKNMQISYNQSPRYFVQLILLIRKSRKHLTKAFDHRYAIG